jgi:hypothetical protein
MDNQVSREKFSTIVNLTYLLHVVAGTIIVVSIRNEPKESKSEDLDTFLHSFLVVIEVFGDLAMLCCAFQPPNTGGKIEIFLIMVFNGLSSYPYIKIMASSYAKGITIMWLSSAALLLIGSFALSI